MITHTLIPAATSRLSPPFGQSRKSRKIGIDIDVQRLSDPPHLVGNDPARG